MTQSVVHCTAEEEVAHYKPREEMGDKLIMEAGHLSDLLSRANCVQFSPSLHLASQLVFLALGPDLRNHLQPVVCQCAPASGVGGAVGGNLPRKLVTRP